MLAKSPLQPPPEETERRGEIGIRRYHYSANANLFMNFLNPIFHTIRLPLSSIFPLFIEDSLQFLHNRAIRHLAVVHRGAYVLVAKQFLHRSHAHPLRQ